MLTRRGRQVWRETKTFRVWTTKQSWRQKSKARPWFNFINVLRTAFTLVVPKSVKKFSLVLSIFLRFRDLRMQKLLVERWWNWHLGSISSTCLHAFFTWANPRVVKIQLSCQYLFTLRVKAARRIKCFSAIFTCTKLLATNLYFTNNNTISNFTITLN